MALPHVYADFQNADALGRIRLNCVGTARDLAEQGVELREGLPISLYSDDADDQSQQDDLTVAGTATYSDEERCWVAVVDWETVRHASQVEKTSPSPTAGTPSRPLTFDGQETPPPTPHVDRS
ncbi:MAG: hypothetical protein WD875_16110 [Pirellulales bacterium]